MEITHANFMPTLKIQSQLYHTVDSQLDTKLLTKNQNVYKICEIFNMFQGKWRNRKTATN